MVIAYRRPQRAKQQLATQGPQPFQVARRSYRKQKGIGGELCVLPGRGYCLTSFGRPQLWLQNAIRHTRHLHHLFDIMHPHDVGAIQNARGDARRGTPNPFARRTWFSTLCQSRP